jgi:4-hydroxy-tetrahydrodipicolinate synthase
MSIYTGSGVALCTPFDKDGKFNPAAYDTFIDFQVANGTAALVSCGTTGESATLTADEHIEVVRTAVLSAKKAGEKHGRKVPVVAGAGGNDTAACIAAGRALTQAGVDALMYVTPYYNKTSQRGLVAHYTAIAAGVDLPIIVYNVPARTALNMQPKTLESIAKIPNIAAVKEASSDITQIAEVIERCAVDMDIYVGNDAEILPVLALGGKGVISTMGNIAPAQIQGIIDKFFAGDMTGSRALQLGILPLVRLLFADVNPMPVKAALRMMGFDMGHCRLPLVDIEPSLADALQSEMKRYGLL